MILAISQPQAKLIYPHRTISMKYLKVALPVMYKLVVAANESLTNSQK